MIRNTIAALVATVALAGVTAPAFADAGGAFGTGSSEAREWRATSIALNLAREGYNVTGVEEWGSLVRAFVIQDDGTQAMMFFDPISLNPVAL